MAVIQMRIPGAWRIFLLFPFLFSCGTADRLKPAPAPIAHLPSAYDEKIAVDLVKHMQSGESVAVSWIYDEHTGDVTALGNRWRDRTESALQKAGANVVTRQEIVFLWEDAEHFGDGENALDMSKAGASVQVNGKYLIDRHDSTPQISLTIKAIRMKDGFIVGTTMWVEPLPANAEKLAATVHRNVFQNQVKNIKGDAKGPALSASLNREPACYLPGENATISIRTEPGVFIYLFDMAADSSIVLLYPNKRYPPLRVETGTFVFPHPDRTDLKLCFYPIEDNPISSESIKVVASRTPLDFSFLPVPMDEIYSGAKGGDILRVGDVLRQATAWSETVVAYSVGEACR